MAATGQGRELPKLNAPKSTKKSRRESPSGPNHQDESELISDADITPKKLRRKAKSPSKKETKNDFETERRNGGGHENPNLEVGEDEQNTNTNNSTKQRPSQAPRKKKRIRKSEPGSTHSLQSGRSLPLSAAGSVSGAGEISESNLNETPTRTKRKRRRKTATSPASTDRIESLGVSLAEIEDDIVDNGTDAETDSVTQVPHKSHMKSQPIGKLYIEQSRGFKSAEKKVMEDRYAEDRRKDRDEEEEPAYPMKTSSMAFALTSIHVFKTFAHFCMGILTGLAIWQTLYAYSITRLPDMGPFLEMYRSLSVPINSVFYIGLVICTVATFDRYDVSKITRPCLLKAFTLQSGAVAALLYLAALCINVSMAPMDDRLGPKTNGTVDEFRDFTNTEEEGKHLSIWKILTVVRAVFIGLAWFIISLRPTTDRLSKNLGQSEVTWGDNDERANNLA